MPSRKPGRPTRFETLLELAKAAWDPVLTMLGREIKLEILDQKPYQMPSPFPWRDELIEGEMRRPRTTVHYLRSNEVLKVHDEMIQVFGGERGTLDASRIQSTLDRMEHSVVEGKDVFPTVIHKAAFLMHSILLYHPFVDGQKRTGLSSAFIFLGLNDYYLWSRSPLDEVHFAIKVAKGEYEVEYIAQWLASKIAPKEFIENPEVVESFIPYAERRSRQCSVCGRYLSIRRHVVRCRRCRTIYKTRINAAVIKGNGKKRRVIVRIGLEMFDHQTRLDEVT